jgi:hypothetical protein
MLAPPDSGDLFPDDMGSDLFLDHAHLQLQVLGLAFKSPVVLYGARRSVAAPGEAVSLQRVASWAGGAEGEEAEVGSGGIGEPAEECRAVVRQRESALKDAACLLVSRQGVAALTQARSLRMPASGSLMAPLLAPTGELQGVLVVDTPRDVESPGGGNADAMLEAAAGALSAAWQLDERAASAVSALDLPLLKYPVCEPSEWSKLRPGLSSPRVAQLSPMAEQPRVAQLSPQG